MLGRLALAALLLTLAACGGEPGHTVDKYGVMHEPGLQDPMTHCTSCHGASLEGGEESPSCTKCHGKKW